MASNRHKHIANDNHEHEARYTTRSTSRHGVSPGIKANSRRINRAAKKADARWDLENQDSK